MKKNKLIQVIVDFFHTHKFKILLKKEVLAYPQHIFVTPVWGSYLGKTGWKAATSRKKISNQLFWQKLKFLVMLKIQHKLHTFHTNINFLLTIINPTDAAKRNTNEQNSYMVLVKSTLPSFGFQIILKNNAEKNVSTQLSTTLTILFVSKCILEMYEGC